MATPTSIGAWSFSTRTGVDQFDSVLGGTQWSSHTLTFSFPGASPYWSTSATTGYGPSSGDTEPWSSGYAPLVASDQVAVRAALQAWSAVANLTFNEVADNQTVVGDMRFAYSSTPDTEDAQAWAYFPAQSVRSGDVWFNRNGTSYTETWDFGSYNYQTALHEIGHALGLKHPFEASSQVPVVLEPALDSRSFTLMSYSAKPGDQNTYFSYEPTTPMVLDIAAIQHLYGANTSHNAGNTNYVFTGTGDYHRTIWDAGGTDTVTYQSTSGGEIDLNEGLGGGSMLGKPVSVLDSSGNQLYTFYNVWIAYDTVIENAVGGSGADTIIGNAVANSLSGGAGNDTIRGGAGNDKLLGGTGNDAMTGGAGNDTMAGGAGNDTYVVNASGDVVTETSTVATEIDTVQSAVSWTLGTNLERLTLTGSAAINGTGNTLANTLTGNVASNRLNGSSGNDTLGGAAGNDTLYGGAGSDRITGGGGADFFVFNSKTGSDTLTDFVTASDDLRISMAGIKVGDGDVLLEGAATRGAAGGFSVAAELVVFTANVASLSTSAAAAAIGAAGSAYAVGRTALFALDNGASSAFYLFTAADANATVSAGELTLLATLSGTASTATGDYSFSA